MAVLAIPLLVIDSPAVAGGLETADASSGTVNAVAPAAASDEAAADENAVSLTEQIDAVAERTDGLAEASAAFVAANAVEAAEPAEGVEVNLSAILAEGFGTFSLPEAEDSGDSFEPAATEELEASESSEASAAPEASDASDELEEAVNVTTEPESVAVEVDEVDAVTDAADESADEPAAEEAEVEAEVETDGSGEQAASASEIADNDESAAPAPSATPPQVDGRVPPPADGPSAQQWDALRRCESTDNYQALNPSGKFRGAYQFSIETWDWVASIHWPHLVGVDPAAAEPAWQDVMAYTLFSMRGWGQWPECGLHLL